MRPALILVMLVGGPPQLSPEEERDRAAQERREQRFERAWKAQGNRAIPSLLAIACGNDRTALDLVGIAARALSTRGAEGVRAVYQYRGACSHFDAEAETTVGTTREALLADLYCEMAGPHEQPAGEEAAELARWAGYVVDDTHARHALATRALGAVVARRGFAACDAKLYGPMLPKLLEGLRRLPNQGLENIAGTFRLSSGPDDELVIHAVAQSGEPEAVELLRSLYDRAALHTKLVIVDALARTGPTGKPALPQVLDLLMLTRDDEARVLSLRTLAAFEVVLDRAAADQVAGLVDELLARLEPRSRLGAAEQDGWALVGSSSGLAVLLRAPVTPGSPTQRALRHALGAPLANGLREQAGNKLLEDEGGLSPADRQCVHDTLHPPPGPPRPQVANAFGLEPTFNPPVSCAVK